MAINMFSRIGTDRQVLEILGARIASHRLNSNLSQSHLAKESGISKRTLSRIEAGHPSQTINLIRVLRALDLLEGLDLMLPRPAQSPLQQIKLKKKQRQRASRVLSSKEERDASPWTWGDKS